MERLSLASTPPPGPGPGGQNAQGHPPMPLPLSVPQLPAQMFTTAAQLLDLTDSELSRQVTGVINGGGAKGDETEKLMISLRDGRKLIGVLRSWDQYANLVLQDTVERIFVQQVYADVPRGLFLVRGENVLLLGEIDLDRDDYIPEPFREAPVEQVRALQKQEQKERTQKDKIRQARLQALGFEGDNVGEVLF